MTSNGAPRPAPTCSLGGCGLLVQMTGLAAVLVLALVLLVERNMTVALVVLGMLLVAGTIAAAWCTLRFLAFEEEGDPPFFPARRAAPTESRRTETQVRVPHPRRTADSSGDRRIA